MRKPTAPSDGPECTLACFLQAVQQMAPQVLVDLDRKVLPASVFDDVFIPNHSKLDRWAERWNLDAPPLLAAADETVIMWLNHPQRGGWGEFWAAELTAREVLPQPPRQWLVSYQVLEASWEEIAAREGVSAKEVREAAGEVARQVGLSLRTSTRKEVEASQTAGQRCLPQTLDSDLGTCGAPTKGLEKQ